MSQVKVGREEAQGKAKGILPTPGKDLKDQTTASNQVLEKISFLSVRLPFAWEHTIS